MGVSSLGKELYAISEIANRINTSEDFQASLEQAMADLRILFNAAGAVLYLKKPGTAGFELAVVNAADISPDIHFLNMLESDLLQEITASGIPVIFNHRHYRARGKNSRSRV